MRPPFSAISSHHTSSLQQCSECISWTVCSYGLNHVLVHEMFVKYMWHTALRNAIKKSSASHVYHANWFILDDWLMMYTDDGYRDIAASGMMVNIEAVEESTEMESDGLLWADVMDFGCRPTTLLCGDCPLLRIESQYHTWTLEHFFHTNSISLLCILIFILYIL